MKKIIDALKKYFLEYFNCEGLSVYHTDDEKIIIYDKKINKKLKITWEMLLGKKYKNYTEEELEEQYNFIYKYLGKINDSFKRYSFHNNYNIKDNKLVLYEELGFYKQSYAEFFMFRNYREYYAEEYDNFKIEDVNVSIGQPSNMFQLINKYLEDEEEFLDWDSCNTIKLYNVTKENLENYLHEALFILEIRNPGKFSFGFRDKNYKYHFLLSPEKCKFEEFKHTPVIEPIIFYNEGVKKMYLNAEDEVAFLYFYKVLEYFFIINRKEDIQKIIKRDSKNIIHTIIELNEIFKTKELECLRLLLKNKDINTQIKDIISKTYEGELVCNEKIDSFAEQLYKFRNSFVHGKLISKQDLKVPSLLENNYNSYDWNSILQKIALTCINEFCYEDSLREIVIKLI